MFGLGFPEIPRPFNTQYRCYSVSMLPGQERSDVDRGGKIIMPPSALDQLTRLNIVYPMLFKLTNPKTRQITHCGVLEFVADEGKIYLPYWMMQNLLLGEGDLINIESASLSVATFSKFQPLSEDFLDITNPKAVLENALRNFACLTTGDVVAITYNDRVYELKVLETKPGSAVSIIECDMNVEFAAPLGYTEPQRMQEASSDEEATYDEPMEANSTQQVFRAFSGEGVRLDGKQRKTEEPIAQQAPVVHERGIPDYNFQIGTLKFFRPPKGKSKKSVEDEQPPESFQAFSGSGRSLRQVK